MLHGRFPSAAVDIVFRGHALKPSDSSPVINEDFHSGFTDFTDDRPGDRRAARVPAFRSTNCAVVGPDLLETLRQILYQQRVESGARPGRECRHRHRHDGPLRRREPAPILRRGRPRPDYERSARPALEPILPYPDVADLDRTYRIPPREDFEPHVYLQGAAEASHGLGDTLLSVLAVRSDEISRSLRERMRRTLA
ncbi:SidA/IucD/PvdA family monooxygenase [Methylobacterium terrae]|uniref:SidA/IucD/PvdA family monooxygenase n=1 Tax=Methylobacterium terrae TaxID=2202827 RepID=UPI0013A5527F|nr:SidA/IucD/PvdA family monooxygenase [Methylobacterium terrae]